MSTETNQQKIEDLKKELFKMQDERKKIEDEIIMHRVVLDNVSSN